MSAPGPPAAPAVAALLAVTAAGTAAYWIAFFAAGNALHSSETDAYVAFEHAFPAADTWMASAAIAAAIGLVRRRPWAVLAGIAAGLVTGAYLALAMLLPGPVGDGPAGQAGTAAPA